MEKSKPTRSNHKSILIGCGIAASIIAPLNQDESFYNTLLDAWEAIKIRNES